MWDASPDLAKSCRMGCKGRAGKAMDRSLGDSRALACTWKLHGFRLEVVQAPLVPFALWGSGCTWDQALLHPL